MSVDLDGTGDYLNTATIPVSAYPFTMAAWVRVDATTNEMVMWLGDNATTNTYAHLDITTAVIRAGSRAAGASSAASSTGTMTTADWTHACGVWTSATARAAYRDGANKGTAATSRAFPAGADQLAIGMNRSSTPTSDLDGRIAEAAVWNVALTDPEIAALGRGTHPLRIRPGALKFYCPLWSLTAIKDLTAGQRHLTAVANTATGVGHAPVSPFGFDAALIYQVTAAAATPSLVWQPAHPSLYSR